MYEGDFLNNKATGKGTYHYFDGRRYEGELVDGQYEGQGKLLQNADN